MHLAELALILWFPIAMALVALFKPQRAVIIAYTVGWLFLPYYGVKLPGVIMDKMMATSTAILLSVLLLDFRNLLRWRPHWVDIPITTYCVMPLVSAICNKLGLVLGIESALHSFIELGIPWFLGRIYIRNLAAVRDMAIAIFVAGIIYAPLCLFEVRFSPQIQKFVYGVSQEPDFQQVIRYHGYRPMVFMQHALAVAMMMTAASLIGFWLWWTGSLRRLCGLPIWPLLPLVFVTVILCKSVGAILLLVAGMAAIVTPKHLKTYAIIIALLAISPVYCILRGSGLWTGETAVKYTQQYLGTPRAASLDYRMGNENAIARHVRQHWLVGWGPGADFFTINKFGSKATPDGAWIIALGTYGVAGLTAFLLSSILPCLGFIWLLPMRLWEDPRFSAATGLVVFTAIFGIDGLMNAMPNPNWSLAAGGLGTMTMLLFQQARQVKRDEYQRTKPRASLLRDSLSDYAGAGNAPPRKAAWRTGATVNH